MTMDDFNTEQYGVNAQRASNKGPLDLMKDEKANQSSRFLGASSWY